ncbi:hypothetical protein HDU96_001184 [Phlyctochytrium bullatum]|nr:hypothetical protein HDU96_001184 [Phlyctochytrium bullatum]
MLVKIRDITSTLELSTSMWMTLPNPENCKGYRSWGEVLLMVNSSGDIVQLVPLKLDGNVKAEKPSKSQKGKGKEPQGYRREYRMNEWALKRLFEKEAKKRGAIDNHILQNSERLWKGKEENQEERYMYEKIEQEYVKFLEEKGYTQKQRLVSADRRWKDVRVIKSGRADDLKQKTLSIDTGIKTFITGVQDNGDAFFLGEDLSAFMRYAQDRVSEIQSTISRELDQHPEVVSVYDDINRRLEDLKNNSQSMEDRDFLKKYQEINQQKRKLALKKKSLLRRNPRLCELELTADHLRQMVRKRRDAFYQEVLAFCSQYHVILYPKVDTAQRTSRNQHWQQRSLKSIMTMFSHETLLKLIKEDARANGRTVVETSEAFSTQTCSRCRHYTHPGRSRVFKCSNKTCGVMLDRDANAAANVKRDTLARMLLATQTSDPAKIPLGHA